MKPGRSDPNRRVEESLRRLRESPIPAEIRRTRDQTPCPSPEVLERFRHGELPERQAEDLAVHLLGCGECAADILARDRIEREAEQAAPRTRGRLAAVLRRPALFWRSPSLLVSAAAAAVLIIGALVAVLAPGRGLLLEASLRGDRGLVRGDVDRFEPGERFRLELVLGKPAAVMVFLEDPEGAVSEAYAPPGGAPLLEGPSARIPPGADGAWDTAGLAKGFHALWILAAPRPPGAADRAGARSRLEEILKSRKVPPRAGGRPDLAEEIRRGLRPGIREVVERPFQME